MPNPNNKECLYYVLGKCARNDEGIGMKKCKKVCELFLIKPWQKDIATFIEDDIYEDLGFNGMREEDYEPL
jgi:hypothetical protein